MRLLVLCVALFCLVQLVAGQCTFQLDNLAANFQFDNAGQRESTTSAQNWFPTDRGYSYARIPNPNGGDHFLQLIAPRTGGLYGAAQTINLNARIRGVITFGAWVLSESVSGRRDNDYSVYLDIKLASGRQIFAVTAQAPVGDTGFNWVGGQYRVPSGQEVESIRFNMLLRGNHRGRAVLYRPLLVNGALNDNDVAQCNPRPGRTPPRLNIFNSHSLPFEQLAEAVKEETQQ